jgi:FMN phosphatase YigB (HAD superfamily)
MTLGRGGGAELRPCQAVLGTAARARAHGIPTGVLSNSWGSGDGYDAYAGYDLERRFDAVMISDQGGMSKPDEEIYRLAAGRLGVEPEECVFADDNPSRPTCPRRGRWGWAWSTSPLPRPGSPRWPRCSALTD